MFSDTLNDFHTGFRLFMMVYKDKARADTTGIKCEVVCVYVCAFVKHTSVLCTRDPVPSSLTLKISRNGSDLLKKS